MSKFSYILGSCILVISISSQAWSNLEESLESAYKQQESEISQIEAKISAESNPDLKKKMSNDIFRLVSDKVIHPSLTEYLKDIINGSVKSDFNEMIKILGQWRNKIAKSAQVENANYFGVPLPQGRPIEDQIGTGFRDPKSLFHYWGKYLWNVFGLDEIDFTPGYTCMTIKNVLESHIKMREPFKTLLAENNVEFSKGSGPYHHVALHGIAPGKDDPISAFLVIFCQAENQKIVINKENLFFKAIHLIGISPLASKYFNEALKQNLSLRQFQEDLAKFYFYYNHSSVFIRGQASVGEWLLSAMAEAQGYNITFTPSWQGYNKQAMAPDMHALSYSDEGSFVKAFIENIKFSPGR